MKKRILVVNGGGDCPGLNAVIRAIVKRASQENNWEIVGSIEAYNGVLNEPMELKILDEKTVSGIHVKGGTIIKTTNIGGPLAWPIKEKDGSWSFVDRSDELIRKLQYHNFEAVISIGGDGSHKISQVLYEKGCNIVAVPKTIDNDLLATDYTFGFQTAVEIATDAIDKLVTTAESHNRLIILEVMGRDTGWIALHSAIAGGAEICLIPEIPYDLDIIIEKINSRISMGRGFAIIVIAEGAKQKDGILTGKKSETIGYENFRLGGVAITLQEELKKKGVEAQIRTTTLGHLQRGGIPNAFDRILATQFGVKAFEMVLDKKYGEMVAYRHPNIVSVPIKEAIAKYHLVEPQSDMIKTAKGIGICMGDE